MNNMERMEMVRGPESSIYGSDAMTSMVQLWTATGDTRTPEIEFGADGGNYSTAQWLCFGRGRGADVRLQPLRRPVQHQGPGHQRCLFQCAAGRERRRALSQRVALRFRLRHSNNFTGIQSNWWFNGDPVMPPDSDQYAHQNNFLASAALTVGGPGPWQHQISGFEYNHLRLNTDLLTIRTRPFDSPFDNLARYNRAGFSYQGTWAPRSWALTTSAIPSKTRTATSSITTPPPDDVPASRMACASTIICSRRKTSCGSARPCWPDWPGSTTASFGSPPCRAPRHRCCSGTAIRPSAARGCAPATRRASRSPASSSRSALPERFPRCPIPI